MKNEQFNSIFRDKFRSRYLLNGEMHLKAFQNGQSPLQHLMKIDNTIKGQQIIKDLIKLTISFIKLGGEEILNDAFYNPSQNSLTYAVLFNDSLKELTINADVIKSLRTKWGIWKLNGVRAKEIKAWTSFKQDQKAIVYKIWALVTEKAARIQPIDTLFDFALRDMNEKLEMNEKVVMCLNAYCQQANDIEKYRTLLEEFQGRFEMDAVRTIHMPKALSDILPFAEKLNTYITVHSWKAYLDQKAVSIGNF